jgi:hypothetical protein
MKSFPAVNQSNNTALRAHKAFTLDSKMQQSKAHISKHNT